MRRGKIFKKKEEVVKVNAEFEKLVKERNEFAGNIDKELLRHYEYIRESKGGQAVAGVEDDICGGCHIALRPQVINDVCKEQELIICDSCSRILYKK